MKLGLNALEELASIFFINYNAFWNMLVASITITITITRTITLTTVTITTNITHISSSPEDFNMLTAQAARG